MSDLISIGYNSDDQDERWCRARARSDVVVVK